MVTWSVNQQKVISQNSYQGHLQAVPLALIKTSSSYFTKLFMPKHITPLSPPLSWTGKVQHLFGMPSKQIFPVGNCMLSIPSVISHELSDCRLISMVTSCAEFSSIVQIFINISKYQRASDYLEKKNHAGSLKIAGFIFATRLAEKSLKIYREIKPIKKIPPSNMIKKICRGTAAFTSILHWPIFLIFLEHCAPFLTWTAESWEGKDDRLLTEQVWNTVPRNSLGLLLTFQQEKKHLNAINFHLAGGLSEWPQT